VTRVFNSFLRHGTIRPLTAIVITLIFVIFSSQVIVAQFSSSRTIGSRGTMQVAVGVGVYWDVNCSVPVSSLDWGSVFPGSVKNITVFIRNEGDEPSTLFLRATNWSPLKASNFMVLNWDYSNPVVYSRQTFKVVLTLSVASVAEGVKDFSFDVIIGVNG